MAPPLPTAYLEQCTDANPVCIPMKPGSSYRFGREATNTIILSDERVSRYHAVIDCREGAEYVVTDLGSRNGTLLNGSPIRRPTRLIHGDEITIAPFVFIFHDCSCSGGQFPESLCTETASEISVEVITVLVMDIRGYTDWARRVDADDVATFMAGLFGEADTILGRNRVWAVKYIGDAVMAIWRHLRNGDMQVVHGALISTVEMFQALDRINSRFQSPTPLRMGAGLNTGPASLGNLGSDRSSDYTALGDSVNKAFRLEAATRTLDCDILLGNTTYQVLKPSLRGGEFCENTVLLKGYEDTEPAWSISVEHLGRLIHQVSLGTPGAGH